MVAVWPQEKVVIVDIFFFFSVFLWGGGDGGRVWVWRMVLGVWGSCLGWGCLRLVCWFWCPELNVDCWCLCDTARGWGFGKDE